MKSPEKVMDDANRAFHSSPSTDIVWLAQATLTWGSLLPAGTPAPQT